MHDKVVTVPRKAVGHGEERIVTHVFPPRSDNAFRMQSSSRLQVFTAGHEWHRPRLSFLFPASSGVRLGITVAPHSSGGSDCRNRAMPYFALACDYDGTLAKRGIVGEPTIHALTTLRKTGRKLILVSGRR